MRRIWRERCRRVLPTLVVGLGALWLGACHGPQGRTVEDKRTHVRTLRDDTLAELYRTQPGARAEVAAAAGYGVFSNFDAKIFAFGSQNGYGILVEQPAGRESYWKVLGVGGGVGMGVRFMREVMVFRTRASFERFQASGLDIGGDAEASAKLGGEGAELGLSEDLDVDIRIYRFTDTGFALAATVSGTTYIPFDELNEGAAAR
jgi:lipid-binding SYLF domain-containing protein